MPIPRSARFASHSPGREQIRAPLSAWMLHHLALAGVAVATACRAAADGARPGTGEPCIPEDERFAEFSGFSVREVNIETPGATCEPGLVCLVSHFQGRVTCPEGQARGDAGCSTTNGAAVSVAVPPQLESRPAAERVVCSCRCDGPDPRAQYCACPGDMVCEEELVAGGASSGVAGSYCTYPAPEGAAEEPSLRPVPDSQPLSGAPGGGLPVPGAPGAGPAPQSRRPGS